MPPRPPPSTEEGTTKEGSKRRRKRSADNGDLEILRKVDLERLEEEEEGLEGNLIDQYLHTCAEKYLVIFSCLQNSWTTWSPQRRRRRENWTSGDRRRKRPTVLTKVPLSQVRERHQDFFYTNRFGLVYLEVHGKSHGSFFTTAG